VRLEQARAIVDLVVSEAAGPVSVFVADGHGELVAGATMDGAAPDTRLNAQRKAYTAARSDATSTRALAEKAREDAVERASFDPFFTFFLGGLAAFEEGRRVGAVGVSGLINNSSHKVAQSNPISRIAHPPEHREPTRSVKDCKHPRECSVQRQPQANRLMARTLSRPTSGQPPQIHARLHRRATPISGCC